jgi:hypothetical protein
LDVVVCQDAREFGDAVGDLGSVAIFEELQDLSSSLSTVSTSTQTSVEALLRTSLPLFLVVYKLTFMRRVP